MRKPHLDRLTWSCWLVVYLWPSLLLGQAALPSGAASPSPSTTSAQQVPLGQAVRHVTPPSPSGRRGSLFSLPGQLQTSGDRAAHLRATGGFLLVLGGLLVAVWLMRGSRSSSQIVPAPVAELLGKLPFPGRPPLHLLRFGSKLVLISAQGPQVQTVAEVTDPQEVLRLTELCRVTMRRGVVDADLASEWAQRISQPELEVEGRLS